MFLAACDHDERVIAKIVWKRTSPTLLDSFLIVDDFSGARLLKAPLQYGRDHPIDVYMELLNLSVKNRTVFVQTASNKEAFVFKYSPMKHER